MPGSCSITYTSGTGTPEAIDISSTTLRRRRRCRSVVSSATGTPPICCATASPPPRSEATRYSEPIPTTPSASSVDRVSSAGSPPNTSSTPRSTATTIPTTANANSSTSRDVLRRACAWRSKKFIGRGDSELGSGDSEGQERHAPARRRRVLPPAFSNPESPIPSPGSSELHLRCLAHLGAIGRDVEQCGRREVEHARDDARGKHLAPVVVGHDRVVVGLAGEGDLVLGAGQLFCELHHVLVGLEVRVGLRHRQQPAERAVEHALRLAEFSHRRRIARI